MSLVGDGSSKSWIDPTNEDKRGTRLLAHILLALVLTIGIVFFLWANQAVLDEVTLGEGRVIPSSTVQVIQNLEGGIVSEILVREGQIVEANEVLLRVANSISDAQVADLQQRRLAKFATIARLQAEITGVTSAAEIKFSEELLQIAPEVASEEMELFEARQLQLNSQISVFEDQVRQRETEINELNVRENSNSAAARACPGRTRHHRTAGAARNCLAGRVDPSRARGGRLAVADRCGPFVAAACRSGARGSAGTYRRASGDVQHGSIAAVERTARRIRVDRCAA